METFITNEGICRRWQISEDGLKKIEKSGRLNRENYKKGKGYPLELIEKIDAEDSAKKLPDFNPRDTQETIWVIAQFRKEICSTNIFCGHISREGGLSHGLGVVLWSIHKEALSKLNKKRCRKGKCNRCFELTREFFYNSRYADKLSANPKRGGHSTIMRCLVEAEILEVIGEPEEGVINTEYRIDEFWLKIYPRKLNDWQKKRVEIAKEWVKNAQAAKRPWLAHIDATYSRTILLNVPQVQKALNSRKKKPSTKYAIDSLEKCKNIDGFQVAQAKYVGTIYHPLSSLPKELVPCLRIDNENIAQLDISSAHPSILVPLLLAHSDILGSEEVFAEANRLRLKIEDGSLYSDLARICRISPERAKKRLLAALNGKNGHTYNEIVFIEFARLFPLTKRVVAKLRFINRKNLNRKMSYYLAQIIDEVLKFCMDHNLPAFPRTDEIVCRQRDANTIREVMARVFHRVTTVNPRIGGTRLEFGINRDSCSNSIISTTEPDLPIVNNKGILGIERDFILDSRAA